MEYKNQCDCESENDSYNDGSNRKTAGIEDKHGSATWTFRKTAVNSSKSGSGPWGRGGPCSGIATIYFGSYIRGSN